MRSPVFFFDLDKTLYNYDFHKRLPTLARLTGSTQYHLAKSWWVSGEEEQANSGKYPSGEDYLAAFTRVTGVELSRDQWVEARREAMSPRTATLALLPELATRGTVALLSNNPSIFREEFATLAPEASATIGEHDLVSASLKIAKPNPEIFRRACDALGVTTDDVIFIDDKKENIIGAETAGIRSLLAVHDDAEAARNITVFIERFLGEYSSG